MPDEPMINTLVDLMSVVDSAHQAGGVSELWWRGQSADWPLVPSAFREGRGYDYEQSVATRFKQRAPTRHSACPSDDDWAAWLFLMQHYRAPTRLLDWTRSPLVAAFFASAQPGDADGILWCLDPFILNQSEIGPTTIFTAHSQFSEPHGHVGMGDKHFDIRDMFREAFFGDYFSGGSQAVLAVKPDETDHRMRIQLSAFTIHGRREPLSRRERVLWSYTVPAMVKLRLRQSLAQIGITRSYIFPDLENLAMELIEWHSGEPVV